MTKRELLTKKKFARIIHRKYGLTVPQAEKIIDLFVGGLEECLRQGKGLRLLGKFSMEIKEVKECTRKDPLARKNGVDRDVTTPAHYKIVMKARKDFKDIVKEVPL